MTFTSEIARIEYERTVERIEPEDIHLPYVQMYAMVFGALVQAVDELKANGAVFVHKDGTVYESPAVNIASGLLNDLREYIAGLGAKQEAPEGFNTFDLKQTPPSN